MWKPLLIGLGAGAASSLLAARAGSVLLFIAPLPLMIAGLAWRSLASATGAVFGTAVAAAVAGPWGGVGFALMVALPAVWLPALALLARPVEPGNPAAGFEWYPAGRLLLWTAALAPALVLATLVLSFGDTGFERRFAEFYAQMLRERGIADAEAGAVAAVLAGFTPACMTLLWMLVLVFDLWAAGRVVRLSGRSPRPWPDLGALALPPAAVWGLAAAVAALFGPGFVRVAGGAFTAALTAAFMFVGLAVAHAVTRGRPARPVMLGVLYAGLALLPWTGLLLALLGLAEPALKLRERRQIRMRPNGPRSTPQSHVPPGSPPSPGPTDS